jgi:hypothetical protein
MEDPNPRKDGKMSKKVVLSLEVHKEDAGVILSALSDLVMHCRISGGLAGSLGFMEEKRVLYERAEELEEQFNKAVAQLESE